MKKKEEEQSAKLIRCGMLEMLTTLIKLVCFLCRVETKS